MKYKLLVLDVDGTLLNDEREISKRTLAALLKVQQMGVRIVLASGRPTYGLMPSWFTERTGTPRIDGKLGHSIHIRFGRARRSNHTGRLPYPPTLRHSAWRCHPCLGRNRCRARLHDYLQTWWDCRGNASQRKSYFFCTRRRYRKGSRHYPAQRTLIPYMECGCIYFHQ